MRATLHSRSNGRTTITLTPDSARTRLCYRHAERKAVAVRITTAVKPILSTVFAPECTECAARKVSPNQTVRTL